MKKFLLLGMICFVCFSFSCSQATSNKFENFQWLEGKWERINVKAPKKAFEEWKFNETGQLIGKAWVMIEQDTAFIEKLSLVKKEGEWYYVADVSHNSEPTYFKLVECKEKSFVSENLTHDFPKQISYSLEDDVLSASISGNGKSIPFQFRRVTE